MVKKLKKTSPISTKTLKKQQKWSNAEYQLLRQVIEQVGTNWLEIAQFFPNRNANQCAQTWKRLQGQCSQQKLFWSQKEDEKLVQLIKIYGKKWSQIAQIIGARNGKQCRERYFNYLDPQLKFDEFSIEEDQFVYEKYLQYGSKWSQISKEMKTRSSNQVKNRFYTIIRAKYMKIKNPYLTKQTKTEVAMELENTRKFHYINFLNQQVIHTYEQESSYSNCQDGIDKSQQIDQEYSSFIFQHAKTKETNDSEFISLQLI